MTATDVAAPWTYGLQTPPDLLMMRYRSTIGGGLGLMYHGGHDHRAAAVHPLYLAQWGIDYVRDALKAQHRCDMIEALPASLPLPRIHNVYREDGQPDEVDPLDTGTVMLTIVYTCGADRIPDRTKGHVFPDGSRGCCGWERRVHIDWSTGAHQQLVAER